MPFVKVQKTKAYFRRFQVKYRRRREGKTDFAARKRLTVQAKNKYNTPKYRLVVRFSNKDIVAQIAYAKLKGDVVMTSAYSHELPRYGLETGLTNYSAAYAVGLLLARRHLKSLKLDDKFQGKPADGADWSYNLDEVEGPKPFHCNLDTGLVKTSTGARVFATLKGALDGGLDVPHSPSRFAGFEVGEGKEGKLNQDVLRKYLFGGHVAAYMKLLKEKKC